MFWAPFFCRCIQLMQCLQICVHLLTQMAPLMRVWQMCLSVSHNLCQSWKLSTLATPLSLSHLTQTTCLFCKLDWLVWICAGLTSCSELPTEIIFPYQCILRPEHQFLREKCHVRDWMCLQENTYLALLSWVCFSICSWISCWVAGILSLHLLLAKWGWWTP
jgi:hypothetical protein